MEEQRRLEQRFSAFWKRAGLRGDPTATFWMIMRRYSEAHRQYHAPAHLESCFWELDQITRLIRDPLAVEGAIWFHDIVYDPRRADNEEQSAKLARGLLARGGASRMFVTKVRRLILATRHAGATRDRDTAFLVDIDLSILGAEQPRFDEYERGIRKEYMFVPEAEYRIGRGAVLRRFLDRRAIFQTAPFKRRLERQAHENLERSIARLFAAG